MRPEFCATLILLCAGVMCAQQPAPKVTDSVEQAAYVPTLTFDVASIRESKPDLAVGFTVSGTDPAHSSLVRLSNYDAVNLLIAAYGVDPAQLVGLPEWIGHFGPLFNVEAKADEATDERLAKLSDKQARLEKQHMMQVLLADRFQLKVHWETKEGPIYELVVAKNGPKLQPGGSMPLSPEDLKWTKLPPIHQRGNGVKGYEFSCHSCTLQSLVQNLTLQMGKPVIDKTGLSRTYDFVLQYKGRGPDANDDPSVWPPLLTAVPDQHGLKLQPAKGEKQFLVIDHMERPSAN